MTTTFDNIRQQLSDLFGTYRAEWLQGQLFDLFTEPRYFPELTTRQSCVLVGGRGTGKTTVLRGLSYEGQRALSSRAGARTFDAVPFIGLYHRINTNHVTAFQGVDLSEQEWVRLFAHYFNLLLCELLLDFLAWHEDNEHTSLALSPTHLKLLCKSLHLPESDTHRTVQSALIESRVDFEAFINNVADGRSPPLSLQQRPIDQLCEYILTLPPFSGKHFFFLLDEYENLLPYQQRVVNTLIKHTNGLYFFKIGVRELGWSCRTTLRPDEQLIAPADYALVKIGDKLQGEAFLSFARDVCETRLQRVQTDEGTSLSFELESALPGLSVEEEAVALGVEEHEKQIVSAYSSQLNEDELRRVKTMSPLELFFFDGWCKAQKMSASQLLKERDADQNAWKQRYDNYKFATLFAIRKGKRGIDKYYCGIDTFAQMSAGNIRYMLELVDHAFLAHIREGASANQPIPPDVQTKAAQRVGAMNLSELEGLSVSGARLTKLLLALGRVFQQLAATPFGHAPEVNQFHLRDVTQTVDELLRNAVMHLALLRFPGTKLGDEADTLEHDYAVHPIFSALFEFSSRRKRKLELTSGTIDRLITSPKDAIDSVLKAHNRTPAAELPRQLSLFAEFYSNDE